MAQNLQPPLFGAGPVLDTELDDDFEDFLIPDSSKFDFALGISAQPQPFSSSFGQLSDRDAGEVGGTSMFDGTSENRTSPTMDLPARSSESAAIASATHGSTAASDTGANDFIDRPGGRAKRNSAKAASSRISAAIESERSAPPKKSKSSTADVQGGGSSGGAGGAGGGTGSGPVGLVKVSMASIRRPTIAETVAAAASAAAAAAAAAVEEVEGASDEDGWDDDEFEDDEEGGEGTGKRKRRAGDPDDRLARSRERNRLHARKSRLRKKFFVDSLKSNLEELEAENRKLRAFIEAKCGITYEDLQAEGSGGGSGAHPGASASHLAAASEERRGAGSGARPAPNAAHTLLARPGQDPSAVLEGSDYQLVEALTKSQQNFVISDPNLPDNPIVFASAGFYELTGYAPDEVIGRNCRFLQGPKTDPDAITAIRQSIQAGRDCAVCLINYKKDGTPFWNRFFVAPLKGVDGKIVNFVGVQCEVKANVASALMTVQGGPHKEYTGTEAGKAAALMAGGAPLTGPGAQADGAASASSKTAGAGGTGGTGSKGRKR